MYLGITQGQTPKTTFHILAVGGDVKTPRLVWTPGDPLPDSVNKNLQVRLSFVVSPDGSVAQVRLLKPSRPDFDAFAIKLVGGFKFEPALKDGKPVAVRLEIDVKSHRQ
jgi:TonB family protein